MYCHPAMSRNPFLHPGLQPGMTSYRQSDSLFCGLSGMTAATYWISSDDMNPSMLHSLNCSGIMYMVPGVIPFGDTVTDTSLEEEESPEEKLNTASDGVNAISVASDISSVLKPYRAANASTNSCPVAGAALPVKSHVFVVTPVSSASMVTVCETASEFSNTISRSYPLNASLGVVTAAISSRRRFFSSLTVLLELPSSTGRQ